MDLERKKELDKMLSTLSDYDYDMVYALVERLYEDYETSNESTDSLKKGKESFKDDLGGMDEDQIESILGDDYLEKLMMWKVED